MVDSKEKRFLNSGGFMGYASDIYEMITSEDEIKDPQLFFTKLFLKEGSKRSMVLDKRANIFMNIHGAVDELAIPADGEDVYVKNVWTDSVPTVIHGNGPAKKVLSYLSNYIAHTWSPITGCLQSKENTNDITKNDDVRTNIPCLIFQFPLFFFIQLLKWPMVYIGLFIEYPTPFLREYFEKIQKITYPKQRIGMFIHNQVCTP
jgi:hypothetical protein